MISRECFMRMIIGNFSEFIKETKQRGPLPPPPPLEVMTVNFYSIFQWEVKLVFRDCEEMMKSFLKLWLHDTIRVGSDMWTHTQASSLNGLKHSFSERKKFEIQIVHPEIVFAYQLRKKNIEASVWVGKLRVFLAAKLLSERCFLLGSY